MDPAAWRLGVGRRLMTASLAALAEGYRSAELWVLATNSRARGFYSALGWWADGRETDDVLAGESVRVLRYRHDL